jgi:hypothetical protein
MTIANLANIATIAQGIFVIISLSFIIYQLRENLRLTRASNTQALFELSAPFNLQLTQDPQLARLWISGPDEWEQMDTVAKFQYKNMLTWWLMFHENIYHQWTRRLVDSDTYLAWFADLQHFCRFHKINLYWDELKSQFENSFAKHVDSILGKMDTNTAQQASKQ